MLPTGQERDLNGILDRYGSRPGKPSVGTPGQGGVASGPSSRVSGRNGGGLRRVDGARRTLTGSSRGRVGGSAVANGGDGIVPSGTSGTTGSGYRQVPRTAGPGAVRASSNPGTRTSTRVRAVPRQGSVSYADPAVSKGTAYWTPYGYYHKGYGHSVNFGLHFSARCGSSYWYWNWPYYYGWYAPYRFHRWYYPTYCSPGYRYYGGVSVVYVYDDDDDYVVVDDQDADVVYEDDVVFAGEAAEGGRAVVAVDGQVPALAEDPEALQEAQEPLNSAAERYLTLGDQAFRDERFSDAVHFYARAIEFAPEEGVLYLVLADALFATGDYHYAAYAVRKALDADPALLDSVIDKRGFYTDPSEFDRQLAVLETYVRDHPMDTDARLVLAINFLFGGRPAAAVDLLAGGPSADRGLGGVEALVLERARDLQHGPTAGD